MFVDKKTIKDIKFKLHALGEVKLKELPYFWYYPKLYISSIIREKLGIYKNEPPKHSLRHDIWQLMKKKVREKIK